MRWRAARVRRLPLAALRVRLPLTLALSCAALAAGFFVAPAAQARKVPFGFFGVTSDVSSIRISPTAQRRERDLMVRSGVESVRVLVSWQATQRHKSFSEIPKRKRKRYTSVGGIPTDFGDLDSVIGLYSAKGLSVLPVVAFSPPWASTNAFMPGAQPADVGAYGRFLTALVKRYGPHGKFWRKHKAPRSARIRRWQIWNEEDLPFMWGNEARNFAPEYVPLLRAARSAVKGSDHGAKIILGGLTSSISWPQVWDALDAVYKAGGRGLFDLVAIHPYTKTPEGVLEIARRTREVMDRNGDPRTPILLTEFSWSSRKGHSRRLATWEVTRAQQAKNLTKAYSLLAANRRKLHIDGAYWYAWLTNDHTQFWSYWSGLRKILVSRKIQAKPALAAYRRAARRYEGCTKRKLATRCG